MDEIDLRMPSSTRAESVLPTGYTPTMPASEPVAVITKDNAAEEIQRLLKDADRRRGTIGVALAVLGTGTSTAKERASAARLAGHAEQELAHIGDRLKRALRAVGLLVPALLVAVCLAVGAGAPRAEAMEAPQPDPVVSVAARTVPVVLGAVPVTVYVRATVYTPVAPGFWCASVYTARGRVGATCSISPTFPIPVRIDPRTWPVGRSFAQVVDDATDVAVSNVTFDARRPSRFGVGTFLDMGRGDLYVHVPVTLYSPTLGRWVPQVQSPVQIQELTGGVWRVRATLTTNPPGLAVGIVHLGGGRHVIRAVRQAGATVWSTTGRTRTVVLTTEPLDVI